MATIHSVNERPPYQGDEFPRKQRSVRDWEPSGNEGATDSEVSPSYVAAAVAVIPNPPDLIYNEWRAMGLRMYASTKGSKEGYKIFDDLSRKNEKYDETNTLDRWDEFHRSPPDRTGVNKLRQLATEADPEWEDRYHRQIEEGLDQANRAPLSQEDYYALCGIAAPEEQAAGASVIKDAGPPMSSRKPSASSGTTGASNGSASDPTSASPIGSTAIGTALPPIAKPT